MKHLKKFNESNSDKEMVNDILNIARDEGLYVYSPEQAREMSWSSYWYIDRYPLGDPDYYDEPDGDPVMSNKEFIKIVGDVFDRLDHYDFITGTCRFYCYGGNKHYLHNEDIPDDANLAYFHMSINI